MGHGCEGSFYVAGLKLRSGEATATWTKDGVTRTARVFTDGAQAKAHAARTGEDVVTKNALAQLSGKIAITARIDGVDGELSFDPRTSSRTARRDFDPDALRASLSEVAYRQALELAVTNLPDTPGESKPYSQAVTRAWLTDTSLVGLAGRMRAHPGSFVLEPHELRELTGNAGVAASLYCEHLRHALTDRNPDLVALARTAVADLGAVGLAEATPGYREAIQLLGDAALEHLVDDPAAATSALHLLHGGYGLAAAIITAEAEIEAVLLDADVAASPQLAVAEHRLAQVCEVLADELSLDWTGPEWYAWVRRRAELVVAGKDLDSSDGGLLMGLAHQGLYPEAQMIATVSGALDANGDPIHHLSEPLRVAGEPLAPGWLDRARAWCPAAQHPAEARWATVCDRLDQHYGTVSSTGSVKVLSYGGDPLWAQHSASASGSAYFSPYISRTPVPDATSCIETGIWVGRRPDGELLAYASGDTLTEHRTPAYDEQGAPLFTPPRTTVRFTEDQDIVAQAACSVRALDAALRQRMPVPLGAWQVSPIELGAVAARLEIPAEPTSTRTV